MSSYEYDLFISFNSDARKHVNKFLKMHQKANWKVFKGEFTNTDQDEIIHAISKSKLIVDIEPEKLPTENSEGFLLQKITKGALVGNTFSVDFAQFKQDEVKQVIFNNI